MGRKIEIYAGSKPKRIDKGRIIVAALLVAIASFAVGWKLGSLNQPVKYVAYQVDHLPEASHEAR
jgi:hypothetical protein